MAIVTSGGALLPVPSGLTPEQEDFVSAIRDFVFREVGSVAARAAVTGDAGVERRREMFAKLAELGWLGVSLPEEYGGSGGSLLDACLFVEEMGRGVPMTEYLVGLIVANTYLPCATEEQKRAVVSGVASGGLASFAISEPEAGSDVGNLSCRAERVPGGFEINGQKTWISNAHLAERILLVCRTDTSGSPYEGLSMIEIPADAEGLEVRGIDTMVGHEVNDVYFADCFAADDQVVGGVGAGWAQLMAGFNHERVSFGALSLGVAARALEDAVDYMRERHVFGRPVSSFQVQRHRIADLAMEIECTRSFVHDIARRVDADPTRTLPREASMVKLKASELAKRVALECQQMMGGYGIATEYGMERTVRFAIAGTFGGGTADIHRETIAKTLGL